jgi:8-oxo-dGTP pyrophosphatase MutT (NUDIX family)
MGASILPITIHNNKIMFLFGKERNIDENTGYSDFGGGTDKGETPFTTASREGAEELTGFLGSAKDIGKRLKKGYYPITYHSHGYNPYYVHIIPLKYDPQLPYYYNNNQRFLQKNLDSNVIRDTKIFEKTYIEWIPLNDLKRKRYIFRDFYKNIIDLILKDKDKIKQFILQKKYIFKNNKTNKKIHKKKCITVKKKMNI